MDKKKVKELTKAELQIMQLLWSKERAYVNDLLEEMPEPRPAYNTVSTIVRILEKKGFVSHKSYGNTHEYYPVVERETYLNSLMSGTHLVAWPKPQFKGATNIFFVFNF